jgi:hypothetical protein
MPLLRLELYAWKLARTVLRGLDAGNRVWLPIEIAVGLTLSANELAFINVGSQFIFAGSL